MLGPPGSGKTMLAKRIPTILPDLAAAESIETTRIYSAMGLLRAGTAAVGHAALSLAASHDQRRRPGRRRVDSLAGRNQLVAQRRVVSRRVARVQSPHAGSAAPAAGRRHGDDRPGAVEHDVSGQLHADRRVESLPLRLSERSAAAVQLHRAAGRELHEQNFWAAARSDRHSHRSAGRGVQDLSAAAPGTSSASMREAVVSARTIQRSRFAGTPRGTTAT